jgi:hypothetical protein
MRAVRSRPASVRNPTGRELPRPKHGSYGVPTNLQPILCQFCHSGEWLRTEREQPDIIQCATSSTLAVGKISHGRLATLLIVQFGTVGNLQQKTRDATLAA